MTSKVLLLSSSLLVDRVLLHTNLIPSLGETADVSVWATSAEVDQYASAWKTVDADVEPFPAVRAFREIPHNYLRRLNEYMWDYRLPSPSRLSMSRHANGHNRRASVRALKLPARLFTMLRMEQPVEDNLERLLLGYQRSVEAESRLRKLAPDVVVTTGPFQFDQPAISAAAKNLNIRTLAYIPSWDNVTTKNRMVFKYDGYMVWSEQIKNELHEFYPHTRDCPVYVVGAPQFDIFFLEKFYSTREEFCHAQNLDPDRPVIVYAIGSPNFLQEHHGAIELAKRIARGDLGDVQMLIRPHPIHDNAELANTFKEFAPRVRLQKTANVGKKLEQRSQDDAQIVEWINTFRHADVVVNLSSTVTVDAAIFDRPVVNLDFDPQPGQAQQGLIKEVNHVWRHFKPIAESGGVWLVNSYDEMVNAIKVYLRFPEKDADERKWITQHVCGFIDGRCSERMAEAIRDFASLSNDGETSVGEIVEGLEKRRLIPENAVELLPLPRISRNISSNPHLNE
jgi:hypothetical protein